MIYGERIRLRAPERSDIPHFVNWLNDPEVVAGLDLYLPMSNAEEENWFDEMLKSPQAQHPMVIEMCVPGKRPDSAVSSPPDIMPVVNEWVAIGNCGFNQIDWRCRHAEIGIFIGEKRFWNQGYGREAVETLVRFGFETLNLHRIWLRVYASNKSAIRCYENAGFKHEGRMREAFYKDGIYIDILIMSILENERKNAPAPHTP